MLSNETITELRFQHKHHDDFIRAVEAAARREALAAVPTAEYLEQYAITVLAQSADAKDAARLGYLITANPWPNRFTTQCS